MGNGNQTLVHEFILLGFSDDPQLQILFFVMVLLFYLISVMGNFTFFTAMLVDVRLHKPMYFFLSNLSIIDISVSTVTLMKLLGSFLTGNKSISFFGCLVQLYLFMALTCTEFFLLTAMAFDRYVAICNPLRYTHIMDRRLCALLTSVSWIISFINAGAFPYLTSHLSFCDSTKINHFFCELTALMQLSCSDLNGLEIVIYTVGGLVGISHFLLTFVSYIFIISSILRIRSVAGRYKAFSTCSSHLTIVILFYGTLSGMYLRPSSMISLDHDKFFSLLYTIVIPVVNPIIYSLRNKDVKRSLRKAYGVKASHNS